MKFIKIEDKKDVYYIDPYRFPEWYYAAKQYHYIEPDKQYEETHNSDNITAETYSGLREMILKKTSNVEGLTALMSKPLWNEYYCSTDPNGLNIIVDWETNVLTEKVKEYNDRYYVKRLKLGKEYDIIAVISKQWDMCFLIDIEDSFLIGHFDLFYIQYNDHYFEFSPDGISGKKGYCQYADLENEWLSCYDKFDVSDAYLDLEGNIAHADIYYKDPRDNSNVMDVWGIIQYIMENGYCNGYPASSLLRAGVSHSFEDFCEGKQYATFRVKITRNAFEDDYSGMISFELSSEGLSFDVKDDDWGRIYLFIGRQRDYFYIDEYNTENLTQIDFSEWPYVEILDLLN